MLDGKIVSRETITDIEVVSGVDWITITSQEEVIFNVVHSFFLSWLDFINDEDGDIKPVRWQFKGGYVGLALPGFRIGRGKQGYIAILSASCCNNLYSDIINLVPIKITRMDLYVDASVAPMAITGLAEKCYRDLSIGALKARDYALVQNTKGGETLYVGSRSSANFGRLYDKGSEKAESVGQLFRYEIETKPPVAQALSEELTQAEYSDVPRFISSYVHNWFKARGIRPVFTPTDFVNQVNIGTMVSDEKRQLNWLKSHVRGTVQRLINKGREREVIEALGLTYYDLDKISHPLDKSR